MPFTFLTLPEELVDVGQSLTEYLRTMGYTVRVEAQKIEFPYTPTIVARRQSTTLIIEVDANLKRQRVRDWTSYGRSCSGDTRIAVAVPSQVGMSMDDQAELRKLGAGLYLVDVGAIFEAIVPIDLAVNIDLPRLKDYSNSVRRALGPAYDLIQRGHWREGFEDACVALENLAQRYLNRGLKTGRMSIVRTNGTTHSPTESQVNKMTLGQLKDVFLAIHSPNASDAKIGAVLKRLNPDRIRVAHKKRSPRQEAALRRNVGRQLWVIIAGVKELAN